MSRNTSLGHGKRPTALGVHLMIYGFAGALNRATRVNDHLTIACCVIPSGFLIRGASEMDSFGPKPRLRSLLDHFSATPSLATPASPKPLLTAEPITSWP